MAGEADDRYRAPALDKGLDILELLASVEGGLTQGEIARHLDRSPNEFYRMLDRLVKRGYVNRIDVDRYSLSLKLFGLSQFHTPVRKLASYASPFMYALSRQSKQANHLCVFDRGSVIVIAKQEAPDYFGVSIRVGAQMSLFNTGSGHVLLAFRSVDSREQMLAEYRNQSDASELPPELAGRLADIRQRGCEIMPSLQTSAVHNLSAPVLGIDGEAVAVLTCPFIPLINRTDAPDRDETMRLVVEAALQISIAAGLASGTIDDNGSQ